MTNALQDNFSILKRYGYTFGEKMTVYGATLFGTALPVLYIRYAGFPSAEGDLSQEALYYAASALTAIPFSAVGSCFGLLVGLSAATCHRMNRQAKKCNDPQETLEGKVDKL